VETSEGATVARVLLHGRGQGSEVYLNGEAFPDFERVEVPYAYKMVGDKFRALVNAVPGLTGAERLTSFQGAYGEPEEGFTVAEAMTDLPEFDNDYLRAHLAPPETVPAALRPYLAPQGEGSPAPAGDAARVRFTGQGFKLRDAASDVTTFAVTLDVPRISWPVGAARDPETGRLYGVTLGGEGYLYSFDPETGRWAVETSMNNTDATGMIFDEAGRRLVILAGAFRGPKILFHGMDGAKAGLPLAPESFFGLTESLRSGQWPRPGAGAHRHRRGKAPGPDRQLGRLPPAPRRGAEAGAAAELSDRSRERRSHARRLLRPAGPRPRAVVACGPCAPVGS
jgi:hypothetical protein